MEYSWRMAGAESRYSPVNDSFFLVFRCCHEKENGSGSGLQPPALFILTRGGLESPLLLCRCCSGVGSDRPVSRFGPHQPCLSPPASAHVSTAGRNDHGDHLSASRATGHVPLGTLCARSVRPHTSGPVRSSRQRICLGLLPVSAVLSIRQRLIIYRHPHTSSARFGIRLRSLVRSSRSLLPGLRQENELEGGHQYPAADLQVHLPFFTQRCHAMGFEGQYNGIDLIRRYPVGAQAR